MCWPMGALFKTSILFCQDIRNMELEALFWVEDFPAVETETLQVSHHITWDCEPEGFALTPFSLSSRLNSLCPPMQLTGSIWKQRNGGYVCPGFVVETDLKPTPCQRESHTLPIHLSSSFLLITGNRHVCKITLMRTFPFWTILHWVQVCVRDCLIPVMMGPWNRYSLQFVVPLHADIRVHHRHLITPDELSPPPLLIPLKVLGPVDKTELINNVIAVHLVQLAIHPSVRPAQ